MRSKNRDWHADSWEQFFVRFKSYKRKPTYNNWMRPPDDDGVLSSEDIVNIRAKAKRAVERLHEALELLKKRDEKFPKSPRRYKPSDFRRAVKASLIRKELLGTFWSALIFWRDGYACQYCGRSSDGVWRESKRKRTLGLTCDHCVPRTPNGPAFPFANIKTACWSCNGIKNRLPEKILHVELQSLSTAYMARQLAQRKPAYVRSST
jgi:5-methylcytosine-specific restriction endonuclease McrA